MRMEGGRERRREATAHAALLPAPVPVPVLCLGFPERCRLQWTYGAQYGNKYLGRHVLQSWTCGLVAVTRAFSRLETRDYLTTGLELELWALMDAPPETSEATHER